MIKRPAMVIASLAALAAGGAILFERFEVPDPAPSKIAPIAIAPALQPEATPPRSAATQIAAAPGAAENDEQDDGQVEFSADANGRIVLNDRTRLDLERLQALYTPAERERKLTEISATLPREAMQQLYQLMEQYQSYMTAVYQVYPPDREMTTVEQGASQIDGMHGLRVQYFGEQPAAALFGDEERRARELFRLMENEKDPGLTLEEKAERAQRLIQASSPEPSPGKR